MDLILLSVSVQPKKYICSTSVKDFLAVSKLIVVLYLIFLICMKPDDKYLFKFLTDFLIVIFYSYILKVKKFAESVF